MGEKFNDRGPFKAGEVCVIVGAGNHKRFIGCEVRILAVLSGGIYEVDVDHPEGRGGWWICEDNLRRKRPPTTGESLIRAMFDTPPQVERRQPVTAWQAQYDTAQALMKMGVRVKPGVWPVEVA